VLTAGVFLATRTAPSISPGRTGAVQRFVRTESADKRQRNSDAPPDVPVLTDFRLETKGSQVRITDADGSVYVGSWLATSGAAGTPARAGSALSQDLAYLPAAETLAEARPGAATRAAPAIAQSSPPATTAAVSESTSAAYGIPLTVRGTNRTLNQLVSFTGHLLPNTDNVTNAAPATPFLAPDALPSTAARDAATWTWLSNSTMRGQANVGPQFQLQINATPAGPAGQ
jgi:hypothetical protein